MSVTFPPLPKKKYGLIVADPAWEYRSRGSRGAAEKHYRTLSDEDLHSLNVGSVSADPCLLIMWTTASVLLEGRDTTLCRAWGFEPKSLHTWLKLTNLNQLHFGTGYYGRHSEEFFIIATCGKPDLAPFRNTRTVHAWAYPGVREDKLHANGVHSRKPIEFYEWTEGVYPRGPILELFARSEGIVRSDRWQCWGDQAD